MRLRAAALIIIEDKLVLMHRIKEKDGIKEEYYAVPGGGVNENESLIDAAIREVKEEIGINIKITNREPKYTCERNNNQEYFFIGEYLTGKIGTGKGEEFTNMSLSNYGLYLPELVPIKDIIDDKINMYPPIIKKQFINDYLNKNNSKK